MGAGKPVLVTGASTGIGRRITERLAFLGHLVYAGARKETDLHDLGSLANVRAIRLDVTKSCDIANAVKTVVEAGTGLYGVVNNAGIATVGPVIEGHKSELDLVMAVNVRGPYCITRAFGAHVVAARGRFVMIGSVCGILAERGVSAYSMSKHALEALNDSLAAELEPAGVSVSVVEPGTVNTQLVANALARLGRDPGLPDLCTSMDAGAVVDAVEHALFGSRPKRRYLVVSSAAEARMTIQKQIAQLAELNGGHRHAFDRDTLIEMLDEELARCGKLTSMRD